MIKIIYKQNSQSLRQQDIQQCEHTCQSEQDNHGKSKIHMVRQSRESINIISMSMLKMDIAIKHRKSPHQNPQCVMITQT